MIFAIDGADGTGKTTLAKQLILRNPDWEYVKFPGHTKEGKLLRQVLLDPQYFLRLQPAFFAFAADMLQTIQMMDHDKVYICDRYIWSLLVYQVWGNESLSRPKQRIMENVVNTFMYSPDMTFILHTDWRTAKSRCTKTEFGEEDQYEGASDAVWDKRTDLYFHLDEYYPGRPFTILDVTDYPMDRLVIGVENDIKEIIEGGC